VTAYEIPLSATDQRFNIPLNGVTYQLTTKWCAPASAWTLDIADEGGAALVNGIPLVTGVDLLEQHQHLGIAGQLVAQTDGDTFAVPTQSNLGSAGRLYFIASDATTSTTASGFYEAPATPGFNALSVLGALVPDAGKIIVGTGITWITSDHPIPAGTAMIFAQASAPTGWTKSTTHNDKMLRIVSGTGGGSGGSAALSTAWTSVALSGTVAGHTLTVTEIPAHTHSGTTGNDSPDHNHIVNAGTGSVSVGGGGGYCAGPGNNLTSGGASARHQHSFTTSSIGGDGSHTHGITVNAFTVTPSYVDVIICTKD
jgi:hypothetical protein